MLDLSNYSSNEAAVVESLFHIQNKEGTKVPFKLNLAQKDYDLNRTKKNLITKPRQKGYSSYILARYTVACLGHEGTHAAVISHEAKATERLLNKVDYYLKYLNGPPPVLGRHSRNELYFPKTESTFYIGTAGAKKFGRGDTITHLHCSEYAWWESEALRHVAGMFQAVPMSGEINIESTGNGRGNDLFYMFKHCKALGYKLHFWPWFGDEEYQMEPMFDTDFTAVEDKFRELQEKYSLTERQLAWYYMKFREFRGNWQMLKQEYPCEPMDCFQASGGHIFPQFEKDSSTSWEPLIRAGVRGRGLPSHPRPNLTYVLGMDSSGGTGGDDSVIQVLCCDTMEQVFEWDSNLTDPIQQGQVCKKVGECYNQCSIVPEANNHGITVVAYLKKNYPRQLIYKRIPATAKSPGKYGFNTNEQTKAQLVGIILEQMENGLNIYGQATADAIESFQEQKEGQMEGEGDHFVIALGLACLGLASKIRFMHPDSEEEPAEDKPKIDLADFQYSLSFEEVMANLQSKKKKGFYARQVA